MSGDGPGPIREQISASEKRSIGVAVVGAGKIGRHRARLAVEHAAVSFLAVVDIDPGAAEALASEVGADTWSTDVAGTVASSDVEAIIIATQEWAHTGPLLAALATGKPTLVEKPITLDLDEADLVLATAAEHGADLRVGYSMRYAQRYAVAHQELSDGKIGTVVGGLARCYDTLAVGRAILSRSPRATSYSLPAGYPINGMATRIELLGTEGVLLVTEDHGDQVLYSESGYDNAYVDQHLNLAYLGSRTSGEWAGGRMFGRVADETRAWLDHLAVGSPCHITTAAEARTTLEVTLAIDQSAESGKPILLELGQ